MSSYQKFTTALGCTVTVYARPARMYPDRDLLALQMDWPGDRRRVEVLLTDAEKVDLAQILVPVAPWTHVLLVGDPVDGISVHGITGPDDPRIEEHYANETWWAVQVKPMGAS